MRIKLYIQTAGIYMMIAGFSSCISDEVTKHPVVAADTVQVSEAPDYRDVTVCLPRAKDVQLVERYCGICHSLRYIEMQPAMPAKAWDKIVKKMQQVYGTPVTDSNVVNRLVDYLAGMKGVDK